MPGWPVGGPELSGSRGRWAGAGQAEDSQAVGLLPARRPLPPPATLAQCSPCGTFESRAAPGPAGEGMHTRSHSRRPRRDVVNAGTGTGHGRSGPGRAGERVRGTCPEEGSDEAGEGPAGGREPWTHGRLW